MYTHDLSFAVYVGSKNSNFKIKAMEPGSSYRLLGGFKFNHAYCTC